jgi:hypothetical protein
MSAESIAGENPWHDHIRGSGDPLDRMSRLPSAQTEHFQAKACPGRDPGWRPARIKKTRQIKNPGLRFDSIETEKTLASRIGIHVTAPSFGDTHQKILRYASRGRP